MGFLNLIFVSASRLLLTRLILYTSLGFALFSATLAALGLFETTTKFTDQEVGGQSYRIYAISELDAAAFSALRHSQENTPSTLQQLQIDLAIAQSRFSRNRNQHFTNGMMSANERQLLRNEIDIISEYLNDLYITVASEPATISPEQYSKQAVELRALGARFKSVVTNLQAQNNVNTFAVVEETNDRQVQLLIWFAAVLVFVGLIFFFETTRIIRSRRARAELAASLRESKRKVELKNRELSDSLAALINEKEVGRTKDLEFETAIQVAGIGVFWFNRASRRIERALEPLRLLLGISPSYILDDELRKFLQGAEFGEHVLDRLENSEAVGDFSSIVKAKDRTFKFTCTSLPNASAAGKGLDLWLVTDETALFREAEENAKQLSLEELATLSAGLSHDFNNLLAAIVSSLDIVLDSKELSQESHKTIELAIAAALRGSELADSLAKIGQEKSVATDFMDANAIKTQITPILARLVPDNMQFVHTIEPELGQIPVSLTRLDAALINIVKNAVEASKPGDCIKLTVKSLPVIHAQRTKKKTAAGSNENYLSIEIQDEGAGLSQTALEKIFDPFFSTKSSRGRGLGLSMVRTFVEESAGEISVESEEGKGSKFSILLPLLSPQKKWETVPHKPLKRIESSSDKILIVDDNLDLTRVLKANFEKRGLRPIIFENCDDAIANLELWQDVSAIVSDLTVPGVLQGDEFLTKTEEILPEVKKVLISGNFAAVQRSLALENSKKITFLQKPFSIEKLLEAMNLNS